MNRKYTVAENQRTLTRNTICDGFMWIRINEYRINLDNLEGYSPHPGKPTIRMGFVCDSKFEGHFDFASIEERDKALERLDKLLNFSVHIS